MVGFLKARNLYSAYDIIRKGAASDSFHLQAEGKVTPTKGAKVGFAHVAFSAEELAQNWIVSRPDSFHHLLYSNTLPSWVQ